MSEENKAAMRKSQYTVKKIKSREHKDLKGVLPPVHLAHKREK
jgi:hypothetical protein